MARPAKPKNSRSTRKPVTIDLKADAVVEESPSPKSNDSAKMSAGSEQKSASAQKTPPKNGAAKPKSTSSSNASNGSSRFSGISGGLIGGALALIGVAVLQWVGVLPSFAPQPPAVEQVDITPLQSEIESLRSEIAVLQNNAGGEMPEDIQLAIDSVSGVAQATATQAADLENSVQTLSAKVSDIETSISVGAAGEDAGLEALASRIVDLESEMENVAVNPEVVSALQSGLSTVEGSISTLESELTEQMTHLGAQIAAAEEKLAGGASNASVAAAIASAGLKSAIDRGGSFMAELETYASVAGDSEIVTELRNHAAAGVPTISQLTDQFPSVHNRIIAVGEGLAEDASVTDRLMASARSLVQVRTVGDVEGESADQIAARIEARLKESDLAAALAEWESLPDAAKEASAGFVEQLRARQAVDVMVAQALSGAMASSAPASN